MNLAFFKKKSTQKLLLSNKNIRKWYLNLWVRQKKHEKFLKSKLRLGKFTFEVRTFSYSGINLGQRFELVSQLQSVSTGYNKEFTRQWKYFSFVFLIIVCLSTFMYLKSLIVLMFSPAYDMRFLAKHLLSLVMPTNSDNSLPLGPDDLICEGIYYFNLISIF